MSSDRDVEPSAAFDSPAISDRLGYLLKHAQLVFDGLRDESLSSLGVTGRQCAILSVVASAENLSQHEIATALSVDRTTMVALVDELERLGFVVRSPHPDDRRKNAVVMTEHGREAFAASEIARAEAEQRFFQAVPERDAQSFRRILKTLLGPHR